MSTQLKQYLLRILAKRDYSLAELMDKASRKGYPGVEIKAVLSELSAQNLINDRRYAENLLHHYASIKGKVWIRQRMRQHKIPEDVIQEILSDFVSDPGDSLKQKVAAKYGITDWKDLTDPYTRQKISNYLNRQGFGNGFEILERWKSE